MKGEKKDDFDCQNFEQQALKAMYEGKSLEQALGEGQDTFASKMFIVCRRKMAFYGQLILRLGR